jgi:hypothetical protein
MHALLASQQPHLHVFACTHRFLALVLGVIAAAETQSVAQIPDDIKPAVSRH